MRKIIYSLILVFVALLQACGMGKVAKPISILFPKENTTYNITKPYNLGGEKVTVPKNCTIVVSSNGKFYNGELEGNDTELKCDNGSVGAKLTGTWKVNEILDKWFDSSKLSDREILDNINALQSDSLCQIITLQKKAYKFPIEFNGGVGINLTSHTTLKLNTTLQLETRNLDTYYIINIKDRQDVTIEGGKIIGDVAVHTSRFDGKSEWGMGLNIDNSSNVSINNVYISKCWGDGIYIGGGVENDIGVFDNASRNIKLTSVVCDDNRRQGLSIIHVDSLTVVSSSFLNTGKTKMTRPAAGIDIEPNLSKNRNQSCRNMFFVSCTMKGNKGKTLTMYQNVRINDVDNIEKVHLTDCDLNGWTVISAPDIVFERCQIKGTITSRTYGSPVNSVFNYCTITGDVLSITMEPILDNVSPDFHFSFTGCNLYIGDMKNILKAVKNDKGIKMDFTDSKISVSKTVSKQLNRNKADFSSKVTMLKTELIDK